MVLRAVWVYPGIGSQHCNVAAECEKETLLIREYKEYITAGFLQIIQVSKDLYPPLRDLKRNFQDSEIHVSIRAKQVVDYALMFLYARNLSEYYIQIEDDVICVDGYIQAIRDYIYKMKRDTWAMLEFSELGFIGKLFRSSDLTKLAWFMLTFYDEQPVDWLMTCFRLSMAQKKVFMRIPTLFQHMGLKTSLTYKSSKDNKMKDKYFDIPEKLWKSDDPAATVISNMKPYDMFLPELAYGPTEGYFWALRVHAACWFAVVFDHLVDVDRIVIVSGKPKYKFPSGKVEISGKLTHINKDKPEVTCAGLVKVAEIKDGRVDINRTHVSELNKPVKCVVLTVEQSQKNVILNQIAVFKVK